ncbi:hypothetical protein [Pseudoalteromonas umbrosa]|uniref:hypothetical protein n=1 Tax=Pseudoalteromonas umbrosa TaxID=3048489 RepID=UPI0024C31E7F|nr:hypothetical protein [Pseudoalteromonas sp. B95]MDK1290111.1 hypothetical protein [Pseudoalteromonas sp. B95]
MLDTNNTVPFEAVPVEQVKQTIHDALELTCYMDDGYQASQFIKQLPMEQRYQACDAILEHHEQIVDEAVREYARKYVPSQCETPEGMDKVLSKLLEEFEYSWLFSTYPQCYVRSSFNPNWEPLYYFAIQMLPIEQAVQLGVSRYEEDEIPQYKRTYGDSTLCIFSESLVEVPQKH